MHVLLTALSAEETLEYLENLRLEYVRRINHVGVKQRRVDFTPIVFRKAYKYRTALSPRNSLGVLCGETEVGGLTLSKQYLVLLWLEKLWCLRDARGMAMAEVAVRKERSEIDGDDVARRKRGLRGFKVGEATVLLPSDM